MLLLIYLTHFLFSTLNGNTELKPYNSIQTQEISEHLIPLVIIDKKNTDIFKVIMYKSLNITVDSLDFYKSVLKEDSKRHDYIYKVNIAIMPLINNKLTWQKKKEKTDSNIDFKLKVDKKDLWYLTTYIIYPEKKSFFSEYRREDLNFKNISLKKRTTLVMIGVKDEKYYYEKIELNKNINGNINIKLKEISYENINKLF